ncbi:MAG: cytochrome c oxidase subunit 3 [Asticcacaulis sp.]|uniref:cytochrome c oxidase subunit 3 n=1 Tax=Asticcacaulis sp. TaxID=1872648 RepID=UPI003F7BA5AD
MSERLVLDKPLPVGNTGPRHTGLWGLWTLILTEGSLFGYLIVSYLYLGVASGQTWPPHGPPDLLKPGISTSILLASSGVMMLVEHNLKRARIRSALAFLALTILMGAVFVAMQMHEWAHKGYGPWTHLYGSLYFIITGFHMAHVIAGLIVLATLFVWILTGRVRPDGSKPVTIGGLYWHFVDAVWIVVFSTLYLAPHLHG